MQEFYHTTSVKLAPKSIIEPGNYYRMLKHYKHIIDNRGGFQMFGSWDILYREEVLERIRANNYSKKPSRMNCVFLCPSSDGAKHFITTTNRHCDLIYKVKLTEDNANIHIGNWNNVAPQVPIATSIINEMETIAHRYWGNNKDCGLYSEVLVSCPVEVIERI